MELGLIAMDDSTNECRGEPQDALRLAMRERLARFVELQRRAMELLKASPNGYRQYWERNLRQRSIDAKY